MKLVSPISRRRTTRPFWTGRRAERCARSRSSWPRSRRAPDVPSSVRRVPGTGTVVSAPEPELPLPGFAASAPSEPLPGADTHAGTVDAVIEVTVSRALPRPVHRRPGDPRQAPPSPDPAAARDPEWRSGRDRGPRARSAPRQGREDQDWAQRRRRGPNPSRHTPGNSIRLETDNEIRTPVRRLAPHPARSEARGLAARRGPVRVRRATRDGDARRRRSSSSTTSTPTPRAARRRSPTSPCAAEGTTSTRPNSSSARGRSLARETESALRRKNRRQACATGPSERSL